MDSALEMGHVAQQGIVARLAAIIENSDGAILSRMLGGVIIILNGAVERIFGFSAHEAIGQG
jgi:PAS domain S-box-containing protein